MVQFAASELSFGLAGKPLCEPVSFELEAGGQLVVMGPSGCGKTSLLRTLSGLSDPLGGRVALGGRALASWEMPAWRRRVVYVAQRPVVFAGTVLENLQRPFAYASQAQSFCRELAAAWLSELGLSGCESRLAQQLSVGEQQRVALLRAALTHPKVLLLDEPTSALDETSEAAVERLLEGQRRERGCVNLVVTHRPEQAQRLGGTLLELSKRTAAVSTADATGGLG